MKAIQLIWSAQKYVLSILFVTMLLLPSNYVRAQSEAFSLRPFSSSARHWYGIRDKHNVINPLPEKPRYKKEEINKIADNILLFQRNNGGWPKNYDVQAILNKGQVDSVLQVKNELHTTFDNSTTYPHIQYLAAVYHQTHVEKYKEACLQGIKFVLDAQYANGGWPQYYPLEDNYSRRITFNDGGYIGIMDLLKKIKGNNPIFDFVDQDIKARIAIAYDKGLNCILKMQIVHQGALTVWGQQHDEFSLEPAWARAFEPPSICNQESTPIVLMLMDIEHPGDTIVNAIQGAVKWFVDSRIFNTKIEWFSAPAIKSKWKTITMDRRVVIDSTATPIWTRYYELGSGRPLFCDRNSKFLYSMAEVSRERRTGYGWYTNAPQEVLDRYAEWHQKWASDQDILAQ